MLTKTTYKFEVRLSDIDFLGHVHNGTYLTYFEQARIYFFREISKDWDWTKKGLILGRNEIDYILPILFNYEVEIDTRCDHIGNKSFTLSYELFRIVDGKRVLSTKGRSILVCMDYEENKSVEVFDEWKDALEESMQS